MRRRQSASVRGVISFLAAAAVVVVAGVPAAALDSHAVVPSRMAADVRTGAVVAAVWPTAVVPVPVVGGITGVTWLDANADGVNNSAEAGLGGVTVRLFDSAPTPLLIDTQVSNAAGVYAFTSVTGVGPWRVQVETPTLYTITANTVTDNNITRGATANIGQSAAISVGDLTAGAVVNAAVRPQWRVQLGVWGNGPLTGATPFGTDPASSCPTTYAPGDDCSATDNIIRARDSINFLWAVSASNDEGGLPGTLSDVVVEQTITPAGLAKIRPGALPTRCLTASGGGTPPPTSRATLNADGSITFVCNLGPWVETGTSVLLQFDVLVEPSPNSSTIQSTAVAYSSAVEVAGGNSTAPPTSTPNGVPSPVVTDTLMVSAAFKYDLNKALYETQSPGIFDPDGPSGPIPPLRGVGIQWVFGISSPTKASEPMVLPVSFTEEPFFTTGTQTTPFSGGLEYYVRSCAPNNGPSTVVPLGSPLLGNPLERSVVSSGSCTFSRTGSNTSPYTFTLNGIDQSGSRFPTRSANGIGDFSNGPFFIASYRMGIFIPDRAMDRFDEILGNSTGAGWVGNRMAGFEPVSTTGQPNYGLDPVLPAGRPFREPGFCDPNHDVYAVAPLVTGCRIMPNGTISNNVVPGVPIQVLPLRGRYGVIKTFFAPQTGAAWRNTGAQLTQLLPEEPGVSPHTGNGAQGPGSIAISQLQLGFGGEVGYRNSITCDVFDNTMHTLVPASTAYSVAPAATYAWLQRGQPLGVRGALASDWIIEYGSYPITGDDPLYDVTRVGQPGVTDSTFFPFLDTYSAASGRFEGNWSSQFAAANDCRTTAPPTGWFSDPADLLGGVTAVNAVRIRAANPQAEYGNTNSPDTASAIFAFALRSNDVFDGGPHNGRQIPSGTVLANFRASVATRFDTGIPFQSPTVYRPSPETIDQTGDRVTLTRATLNLKQNSVTVGGVGSGAAAIDVTGNANAGETIVWQIQSTVNSLVPSTALTGLKVVGVLPPFVTYDGACTAGLAGGTVPATVEPNTPLAGQTRLTWLLPDQLVSAPIPVQRVCTTTDSIVPNGTAVVSTATISADGIPNQSTDPHTVVLAQPGQLALRKTVDAALDPLDDTQNYTLLAKNLSGVATIEELKLIEVFPYNGDATSSAGVNRTPGSSYTGTVRLQNEPTAVFSDDPALPAVAGTMYYTADVPATVNQNWNVNTSTWCTFTGGTFTGASGTGACPTTLASATAIKFEATAPLQPNAESGGLRDGISIRLTLRAVGNTPSDIYANRFTAFTPTILASNTPNAPLQTLQSNRVQVEVVGFVVGDLVLLDQNDDGLYSAADDALAADGTVVQLWNPGADGAIGGTDDLLLGSTTTTAGVYRFERVAPGRIYIRIPGSEFAPGGPVTAWIPSTRVGIQDANDVASQDASADRGGASSTIHTLSYREQNGVFVGNEPIGDNTRLLPVGVGVADGFTNFTIDIGLVRRPPIPVGSLIVAKVIIDPSPGDDRGDAQAFPVSVLCEFDGESTQYRVSINRNGSPVTVPNIRAGSTCSLTETDTDGGAVSYSVSDVEVTNGGTSSVIVTNRYPEIPPGVTRQQLVVAGLAVGGLGGIGGLLLAAGWVLHRRSLRPVVGQETSQK